MDQAVSRTLLLRLWSVISGFGTVIIIPFFLNPEELGFYYSFSSVIAIQVFFELGLGQVLIYRFADLRQLLNSHAHHSDSSLQLLLFASRLLYRLLAILFFITALISGLFFFSFHSVYSVSWRAPWFLLTAATSINLIHSVKLTFLEAVGEQHHVAVSRLRASFVATNILLAVLAAGGGLWSACALPVTNAIWFTVWLSRHRNAFSYRRERFNQRIKLFEIKHLWMKEILPMQW